MKKTPQIPHLLDLLFSRVDASTFATFRFLFGFLLFYDLLFRKFFSNFISYAYFHSELLMKDSSSLTSSLHFPHPLFAFLRPFPKPLFYLHFFSVSISSLFLSLGLFHPYNSIYLFVSYCYIFFLDETWYTNYSYLYLLLLFLFAVSDSNAFLSLQWVKIKIFLLKTYQKLAALYFDEETRAIEEQLKKEKTGEAEDYGKMTDDERKLIEERRYIIKQHLLVNNNYLSYVEEEDGDEVEGDKDKRSKGSLELDLGAESLKGGRGLRLKKSGTVPYWQLFLFLFQFSAIHFFSGVSKLNSDWFRGEPFRQLLFTGHYGQLADLATFFITYGGLLFDFILSPLLLLYPNFHFFLFPLFIYYQVSMMFIYNVGIYPFVMISSLLLYTSPTEWRSVLRSGALRLVVLLKPLVRRAPFLQFLEVAATSLLDAASRQPDLNSVVSSPGSSSSSSPSSSPFPSPSSAQKEFYSKTNKKKGESYFMPFLSSSPPAASSNNPISNSFTLGTITSLFSSSPSQKNLQMVKIGIFVFVCVYIGFQVTFPLRGVVAYYPADPLMVSWSEEGHKFSWHMGQRIKKGRGSFFVKDKKTGASQWVEPSMFLPESHLQKMLVNPHMIYVFSKFVGRYMQQIHGYTQPSVFAHVEVSLNGRDYKHIVDIKTDLFSVSYPLLSTPKWINKFDHSLPLATTSKPK